MVIALVDAPIFIGHPDLAEAHIREIPGAFRGACARTHSVACTHGTFVAGVLCANRGSSAPAICPGCTVLLRPIFAEKEASNGQMPSATAEELSSGIIDAVEAGARVINVSAELAQASSNGERAIEEALDHAARRGVITVAAAGNQGTVGGSAIVRHPWVIPVVACNPRGRPSAQSNLGSSIGRRGLSAPGESITSLSTSGSSLTVGGTSAAAPFVTGAIALVWSEFPAATGSQVRCAFTQTHAPRRRSLVPPLLDAWAAYQVMATAQRKGGDRLGRRSGN